MSGPMMAPMFLASTAISAVGQMRAGAAKQEMYDSQAADELMKGRAQAIAYKKQGADVLRNLNENLAAIIARSSAGGVDPTSGSAATTYMFGMSEAAREKYQAQDNAIAAKGQSVIQAHQYEVAGNNAQSAANYNALGTIMSGAFMFGRL